MHIFIYKRFQLNKDMWYLAHERLPEFAPFNISLSCFRSVVGYKEHFMLGPFTIAMVLQYCGGGDLSRRIKAAKSEQAPFAEVTVRGGESGSVGVQASMMVRVMVGVRLGSAGRRVRMRVRVRARVRVGLWERLRVRANVRIRARAMALSNGKAITCILTCSYTVLPFAQKSVRSPTHSTQATINKLTYPPTQQHINAAISPSTHMPMPSSRF